MDIVFCLAGFVMALCGTLGVRRYALAHRIMDVPNARSSHVVPTPRGGGVAIVVAFLVTMFVRSVWSGAAIDLCLALLPGGIAVACVGFWDDRVGLPARTRFAVHLVAAFWAVGWLGGWPVLDLGFGELGWGWFGAVVGVLAIAWAINLYNFMDGIDGLAGAEAVFTAAAGGGLLWLAGADPVPAWLLAAASAGFLFFNWPPAKIFMGDAGSGFLGYALAAIALHAVVSGATAPWPWLILLAVFVADATLTLLHRAAQGIRVTEAHRTHAYQWASRRAGGHRPVTLTVVSLNAFVLFPLAIYATIRPEHALSLTLAVYAVLGFTAWKLGAGVPEPRPV